MFLPSKEKPFYYCLKVMQYMHYYPFAEDLNDLEKFWKVALLIRIITCFPTFECLLHLIMSIKNKIPIDYPADIVIIISGFNALIVCNMFQIVNKDYSKLFFDLHENTEFGVPPRMAYTIKQLQCLSYEKQNFSVYYIPPSAMVMLILWEAKQIIILKMCHLKQLLREVFTIDSEGLRRQRLRFCIKYHQEILRVAKDLSDIYKKVLWHTFICGALIGCSLFQTFRHKPVGSFLLLVGYICAIFINCTAGQNLEDEVIQ
ncbi:unnamed protein product [Ceutorhynchus assimilis]|uniref:Uncharacterized protein n=1 Tax=Ceutorhynchus assimilis TaxID=467358 RepID=A0A9N9MW56_9CUCU|nr:unnamed protein product [Ceutorhynchus assimilis]